MLSDFIALSYIIINQKVARLGSAATAPQGDAGRVPPQGRAALRGQYYDDSGRCKSPPNGHKWPGMVMDDGGLKELLSLHS